MKRVIIVCERCEQQMQISSNKNNINNDTSVKGQAGMPPGKVFITCSDFREVWLRYWSSNCEATAIFIALLITVSIKSSATGICATGLYLITYFTRQHYH